jgi:hypothetical protein
VESSTGTRTAPAAPAAERGRDDGVRNGALPTFVVIGAQKCATSGLHYYLSLHPEVSVSRPKELNFFIEERNWPRGIDWYAAHFDARAKARGEASPNYTAFPQHVGIPERMHSLLPDAKLIYLVRDPIDRIAAHWVHNYAKRREKGDLRSTLLHPNTSYLVRSHYHMQLQRFLRLYPLERVLVLDQEDLRSRRLETLREVFEFVGVDPSFSHPRFADERHRTARKTRATRMAMRLESAGRSGRIRFMPPSFWLVVGDRFPFRRTIQVPDVREALPAEALRSLREDGERLRELTGREFESWSIWNS